MNSEKKMLKEILESESEDRLHPTLDCENITSTDKLIDLQIMKCIHKWSTKALW